MLADIRPNEEHAKEHIERNPVTTVAQVVPEMSEHEVRSRFTLHDAEHHMLPADIAIPHSHARTVCLQPL